MVGVVFDADVSTCLQGTLDAVDSALANIARTTPAVATGTAAANKHPATASSYMTAQAAAMAPAAEAVSKVVEDCSGDRTDRTDELPTSKRARVELPE